MVSVNLAINWMTPYYIMWSLIVPICNLNYCILFCPEKDSVYKYSENKRIPEIVESYIIQRFTRA